ncbi:hypothetical protein E3N88_06612 [Mikania micrantha]|uniref:Uncharacterized protein n=1 Tax=Mikania micrantha TaxID=192012 RepID=A0A5N6PQG6_9ASTR|nr:hypothetical protein E3N88_06612 [Mikania micrantha]
MGREPSHHDHLLKAYGEEGANIATTPRGFFAIYVGDEPRRFVVPTAHLSHPLFKMLMEKAYDDEEQNNRLVVSCSVTVFEKVVNTVECCNGMFDIQHLAGMARAVRLAWLRVARRCAWGDLVEQLAKISTFSSSSSFLSFSRCHQPPTHEKSSSNSSNLCFEASGTFRSHP